MVEAEQWKDCSDRPDRELVAALQAIKPRLELVRVRSDIAPEITPPGAVPGLWHVLDRDALPVPNFLPIANEQGGYREPDSGVLHELTAMDMRRPEVAERVFRSRERAEEKRNKARELRREQERDVLREDLRAGWRTKGRIYRDDGEKVKRKQ